MTDPIFSPPPDDGIARLIEQEAEINALRHALTKITKVSRIADPVKGAYEAIDIAEAALRAVRDGRRAPDFDPSNHHNALTCPHCNPRGLKFAEEAIDGRRAPDWRPEEK